MPQDGQESRLVVLSEEDLSDEVPTRDADDPIRVERSRTPLTEGIGHGRPQR
ncbi:hypothetical protein DFP74_4632 [Nocardiopsis sp. Huas11]|nr:hypothetical protein DFP74_4632 [Nocardiopsis sp. Huas11]